MEHPALSPGIVTAFKKGDPQAFSLIFHFHYRLLCRFAAQLVNHRQDGEDIAKDTLIKLWQRHPQFECARSIKAFLYITTRHACLDFLRYTRVKQASLEAWVYQEEDRQEEGILHQMIRTEQMRVVRREIDRLPERRREVLKLAYLEGLKNEEIAGQMDISIHTVQEHKGKGLYSLRLYFTGKQDRY